ncbi:MAG: PQQ-like beta-propeller repeat protein [Gemmatales bacterium]
MRPLMSLLLSLLSFTFITAQDWPQWLGPNRNGSIDAAIAPWKGDLNVVWRVPVGEGHSSPIVADGKVYLHSKVKDKDEEMITAWDLSGKELWKQTSPRAAFTSMFGNGPRATPAVSAGKLYTYGVTGVLICRDSATGKELWKKDTLTEFKAKNLTFGVSSSPLVDDKNVYVMPGGSEGSIVAYNKETGELVWKSGTDKASYSSPMSTKFGDKMMLVFQTQAAVVGLDPATGKEYFRVPLKDLLNESSTTPVRMGDLLFAASVTFGSMGIKVEVKEGAVTANREWKNGALTCYFATPVMSGGLLYAVTGQLARSPVAALQCVDPTTGKSKWKKASVGQYHATVYSTKDNLLMLEEMGDLVLFEPNAEAYKELARAKLCGHTWAHPAYAQGMIFARDDRELLVVKLK